MFKRHKKCGLCVLDKNYIKLRALDESKIDVINRMKHEVLKSAVKGDPFLKAAELVNYFNTYLGGNVKLDIEIPKLSPKRCLLHVFNHMNNMFSVQLKQFYKLSEKIDQCLEDEHYYMTVNDGNEEEVTTVSKDNMINLTSVINQQKTSTFIIREMIKNNFI